MILLDSNVVIYATMPEHAELRRYLRAQRFCVSVVTFIEVLGFTHLARTIEPVSSDFCHD